MYKHNSSLYIPIIYYIYDIVTSIEIIQDTLLCTFIIFVESHLKNY